MKLYHFTQPKNMGAIARHGLKPRVNLGTWFMTNGTPVVWLTSHESNRATRADVEHVKKYGQGYEVEEGGLMYGGPARVTVHLDSRSKCLRTYGEFVRSQPRMNAAR